MLCWQEIYKYRWEPHITGINMNIVYISGMYRLRVFNDKGGVVTEKIYTTLSSAKNAGKKYIQKETT